MSPLANRITATIAYADIFDYPLTDDELRFWLIGGGIVPYASRAGVPKHRGDTERYHHLRGRSGLSAIRTKRADDAGRKWKRVGRFAGYFRIVPTIILTGVTGGLAMDNTDKTDDIDMFFIVRPGTIWISRACATVIAAILGIRRAPNQTDVQDAFCLNMFMSEDSLTLPEHERDLFAAHEVLQMRPVWERGGAYMRFLEQNRWTRMFLPNAWAGRRKSIRNHTAYHDTWGHGPITLIMRIAEPTAKFLQLRYMRSRRTNEVISEGSLRFHPNDARIWVLKNLTDRLKKMNVPLDNIFFHS